MKGKEAVSAARRRESEARADVDRVVRRYRAEAERWAQANNKLQDEVRRLRAEHLAEASRLASEEVERRVAELAAERRKRGLSDEIVVALMWQKDRLIYNACKYLSMTRGEHPMEVFTLVLAWATDRDVERFAPSPDHLQYLLGVPPDGWTMRRYRHGYAYERRVARRVHREPFLPATAVSLDRALNEKYDQIHENYNPDWYPPFSYDKAIVVEDETREG